MHKLKAQAGIVEPRRESGEREGGREGRGGSCEGEIRREYTHCNRDDSWWWSIILMSSTSFSTSTPSPFPSFAHTMECIHVP